MSLCSPFTRLVASTHASCEYVSRYICRRVAREAVHNYTKHVSTPAPRLATRRSHPLRWLWLHRGIRIDGFTGRFRLYAWDNGRRSEPLFAAGRKYASVFAPLFHGNALDPTPGSVAFFSTFGNAKGDFFPPLETKFGCSLGGKERFISGANEKSSGI